MFHSPSEDSSNLIKHCLLLTAHWIAFHLPLFFFFGGGGGGGWGSIFNHNAINFIKGYAPHDFCANGVINSYEFTLSNRVSIFKKL